jgi:putative SOS response-associated peptidase YedK
MCGRYSLAPDDMAEIGLHFAVPVPQDLPPRYNIAPTWMPGYEPPIVRLKDDGARTLELARWWLIPEGWSRSLKGLPTSFNARAEDIASKKFWSKSFQSRRCLVPVTGWREFTGEARQRKPFQFHYARELFAFAGLWDRWATPDGELVDSFAIVTVAANDAVRPVHDRMPLRVEPALYDEWLDPGVLGQQALADVLAAPSPPLEHYASDPLGNSVRREGPETIAPLPEPQLDLFGSVRARP